VFTLFITHTLRWALVLGLGGKVFVVGGYRGGFCEKLLEASPVSDRTKASMEVHGGADIHLQPVEDTPLEKVDAPKGGCDPVGRSCSKTDQLLAEAELEHAPGRTCGLMGRGAHAGAGLLAELVTPWEGPPLGQEQSVRSPPPEEEGVAEITCDELTVTPIPSSPVPLGGRR